MLSHIGTEFMTADGLTKVLGTVKHRRFIELLGMESF